MKRIFATTAAAAMVAFGAIAATPASAGNFNFTLGVGGFGPGWGYGPGYGAWSPGIYVQPQNNWNAHVQWCFNKKGNTYNPNTNMYFKNGWKYCNSPFI